MTEQSVTEQVGSPEGSARLLLSRSLVGDGLEIGPGDSPFPLVFGGARARYVDRWGREDNARLFQEVGADRFVEPDLTADLNVERLSQFGDASQDFVIASHVLEHLVEPIGQLADVFRVLRPGGVLLLLLPDRRRTFDRTRPPTTLAHLVDEHQRGVTELHDDHLEEFVAHVPEDWAPDLPPKDQEERFRRHRLRSIHVHCWTQDEFAEVLSYCIEELGLCWELVDLMRVEDVSASIEFGIALRRPTVEVPAAVAGERFKRVWAALTARSQQQTAGAAAFAATEMEEKARSIEAEWAPGGHLPTRRMSVPGTVHREGLEAIAKRLRRIRQRHLG